MRFARWLFGFWLVIITARYCATVFRALQSPFNQGSDYFWAIIWLTTIAVLILACKLFPPAPVTFVWLTVVSMAAISMLVLSRTFIPFVLACWIVSVTTGLGLLVLKRMLHSEEVSLERLACAVPLGFAVLSLTVFILGLFRILRPLSIWTLLVAASLPAASAIRGLRPAREFLKPLTRERGILFAVMAWTTLLNLTWAIAPEIQYDALNYHLHVPKAYLQHSGFVEIPFLQAYFARLIEYFLTICLAAGGAETAKLWMFLMGVCATVSVFALGKCLFDERTGLWAAAFFHTTPLVSWLAGTVDIDLVVAFFVTCALLAIVRWSETRNAGWYYAACLLAAVAIGSKLNAAFAFVILAPTLIHRSRMFAFGLLAFILVAAPSYALMYSFTGNPTFPLLNGVFQSPKWDLANTLFNAGDFGLDKRLSNLIRLPFRMTLDTSRFGESLPRGALGLSLLLAFPFAGWFVVERRRMVALLVGTSAVYLICVFYTSQYGRYYIPILPLVTVLGVATAFHFEKGVATRVVRICLWIALVAQPLSTPLQFWNDPERFPLGVAFGSESRAAFLSRTLPGYAAAMFLNKMVPADETILGVGTEGVRFYLNAKLETQGISILNSGVRQVANLQPNGKLAVEMKKLGFNRIFVTRLALKDSPQLYPYLNPDFLSAYTILEFEDEGTLVYRLY